MTTYLFLLVPRTVHYLSVICKLLIYSLVSIWSSLSENKEMSKTVVTFIKEY